MTFGSPTLLFVGLILWIIWLTIFGIHRAKRRPAALLFSDNRLFDKLPVTSKAVVRNIVQGFRAITLFFIVIAVGQPQLILSEAKVHTEGIDIVLAIDTSGSMKARDLDSGRDISKRRHRLDVVKGVVSKFIRNRPDDQIGMVVFGTDAFTQVPLTLDHNVVATLLEHVEIGMAGDQTAIGSSIATAVKRLQKSPGKSKVIILLPDGRNNAGSITPKKAAEIA
ncbi:VWA domain-containing protein, partial [Myxococcota bacterium]|nr:VWA domain-containing protein [Myxococcota bacterium]